jgi:hypothetical protein
MFIFLYIFEIFVGWRIVWRRRRKEEVFVRGG